MDEKIQMLKKHWSKGGREEIKGGKCVSRLLPTWFCTPSYPSQKIPKNCRSSGLPHEHTRHVENARGVCVGCWEWGTQSLGLICIDLFSLKLPNVGYEFPNAMNKICLKRAFFFSRYVLVAAASALCHYILFDFLMCIWSSLCIHKSY